MAVNCFPLTYIRLSFMKIGRVVQNFKWESNCTVISKAYDFTFLEGQ